MATLSHQAWIKAPTVRLYEAIATDEGIGRWWDKPKAARSPSGLAWEFNPGPEHGVLVANVLEMIQDRRVACGSPRKSAKLGHDDRVSSCCSETGRPSSRTVPVVSGARPRIDLSSVLLPEPFGPITPTSVPGGIARSTSSSTMPAPYPALTPSRTRPLATVSLMPDMILSLACASLCPWIESALRRRIG